MRVAEVRKFCKLDEAGDRLVRAAMSQLNLSARGYHRVLKLARFLPTQVYPAPQALDSNHLHQVDLVGPIYVKRCLAKFPSIKT